MVPSVFFVSNHGVPSTVAKIYIYIKNHHCVAMLLGALVRFCGSGSGQSRHGQGHGRASLVVF